MHDSLDTTVVHQYPPAPWRVLTGPRILFEGIEDTGAYGLPLIVLLTLTTLLGFIQIQSGLIDQVVDRQTAQNLAHVEKSQQDLVQRNRLKEALESVRKEGEFIKTITRLQVVVLSPVWTLASFLLISACLYAIVALTGRKPEYHTLMSICVYAGFIQLIAQALQVAMMFSYRTLEVDTSLRLLASAEQESIFAGIDPFHMWFWILVAFGLIVTRQLSRRIAILSCSLFCLLSIATRIAVAYSNQS